MIRPLDLPQLQMLFGRMVGEPVELRRLHNPPRVTATNDPTYVRAPPRGGEDQHLSLRIQEAKISARRPRILRVLEGVRERVVSVFAPVSQVKVQIVQPSGIKRRMCRS